jgi:hypothetical protein
LRAVAVAVAMAMPANAITPAHSAVLSTGSVVAGGCARTAADGGGRLRPWQAGGVAAGRPESVTSKGGHREQAHCGCHDLVPTPWSSSRDPTRRALAHQPSKKPCSVQKTQNK